MATVITAAEILEEIIGASEAPEDAMTVQEIATEKRCSRDTVLKELKRLELEGRLRVHRVVRRKMDGHSQIVPAYTLVPKAKGKR